MVCCCFGFCAGQRLAAFAAASSCRFLIASGHCRRLGVSGVPKALRAQPAASFLIPGAAIRSVIASGQHATLAAWRALARSLLNQSALGSAATWERHHQALRTGGRPLLNFNTRGDAPALRSPTLSGSRYLRVQKRPRLAASRPPCWLCVSESFPSVGPVGFRARRLGRLKPPRPDTRKFPGFW
jgi:hypothetical protein